MCRFVPPELIPQLKRADWIAAVRRQCTQSQHHTATDARRAFVRALLELPRGLCSYHDVALADTASMRGGADSASTGVSTGAISATEAVACREIGLVGGSDSLSRDKPVDAAAAAVAILRAAKGGLLLGVNRYGLHFFERGTKAHMRSAPYRDVQHVASGHPVRWTLAQADFVMQQCLS
jgi:hypothetical protein